jgi:hypothetical protein
VYRVAELLDEVNELLLHFVAGVIRSNGYFHVDIFCEKLAEAGF